MDIEMSVLHDAFREKFPGISDQERDECLSAMENLREIERLEATLAQERRQTNWLRSELQRLSGLAPTKPVEAVDGSSLADQQRRMADDLQSLRVRNTKLEKGLNLSQNKVMMALADVDELERRVEVRRAAEEANAKMRIRAEELARENAELADTFRVENAAMHHVQEQLSCVNHERQEIVEFIDANEATIQESVAMEDGLLQILREIDQANAPLREIKARNEEFALRITELRESVVRQLGEVAKFIDVVRLKSEVL
jgi:hypothetical protein